MSLSTAMAALLHLFVEKWFDIVLAFLGTLFGYYLAKRHIEHFMDEIDKKYINLFRERAFHKAVSALLPELPNFHLRPRDTFSTQTADAISEFTQWSVQLDAKHTPEKSMEIVSQEAELLAGKLIEKDLGFREEKPVPNYEWIVGIGGLPATGWKVESAPDLSIYNWSTGVAVQRYARMKETARTATTIQYSWKWSMKDVPCGVYVGVVNYQIGGQPVIGNIVGDRIKISLQRENGKILQNHQIIPWD
jgi:hypothetical protein